MDLVRGHRHPIVIVLGEHSSKHVWGLRGHREERVGHLAAQRANKLAVIRIQSLVPRNPHLLFERLAVALPAAVVHVVAATLDVDAAAPTAVDGEEDRLRVEQSEKILHTSVELPA